MAERINTPTSLTWSATGVLAVGIMVIVMMAAVAAPGSAQTTSPSTTTSTTSTVAPGGPGTTTTTTAPPQAPEPDDDAAHEEAPTDEVVLPERADPPPSDVPPPVLQTSAARSLEHLNVLASQALAAAMAAAREAARLDAEIQQLNARLGGLETDKLTAVEGLRTVRGRMRDRAVAAYTGGTGAELNHLLNARDVNQFLRRAEMVRAVTDADAQRLDDYEDAKARVGRSLESVVSQLAARESSAAIARSLADGYAVGVALVQSQLAGVEVAPGILTRGFVFPVAGRRWFSDTWGAPRMPGTQYAHPHQGTDIFAEEGTPLVACERGVVIRIGTDLLGGTKLWLVGASGTRYYYAHLSGFAPDLHDGMAVEAGQLVGYVGNTGNARTTPPHLHFQMHPNGGAPVNPYPLLKIVDDAVRELTADEPGR